LIAGGGALLLVGVCGAWALLGGGGDKEPKPVERADSGASKAPAPKPLARPKPALKTKARPAGEPRRLLAPLDAAAVQSVQSAWAKYLKVGVDQQNSLGMTLTLIPPGEFTQGSTEDDNELGRKMAEEYKYAATSKEWSRLQEEMPAHGIEITKPFLLAKTEVTIRQFREFVESTGYLTDCERVGFGDSGGGAPAQSVSIQQREMTWRAPGHAVADDSPVTQISWTDAVMFCNWLSEREKLKPCYQKDATETWILKVYGDGYRLPTEAEWNLPAAPAPRRSSSSATVPATWRNMPGALPTPAGVPRLWARNRPIRSACSTSTATCASCATIAMQKTITPRRCRPIRWERFITTIA
jgi:formylglycine-generating enzyme required for sulfatase activity